MLLLTFVLDGVHAMKKHNTKRYKCILEFIDGVYILLFLASMAQIFSIFAAKVLLFCDIRKKNHHFASEMERKTVSQTGQLTKKRS